MVYKIMIASAKNEHLTTLVNFLNPRGYETVISTHPETILDKIKLEKPHLVLLDINMLNQTDIRLLQRIKQAQPFAQAIVMTERIETKAMSEYFTLGFNDFLVNPTECLDETADIVKETCNRICRWEKIARDLSA